MDNFKKCSKCGEVKLLDCFHKDKYKKNGCRSLCKKCAMEHVKKYRAENPEKAKVIAAKSRVKNREKAKVTAAKYRAENPEKAKAKDVKYRKSLPDAYIKHEIKEQTGVPYEHITQDLIETKRLHILIQRKLKDLTK